MRAKIHSVCRIILMGALIFFVDGKVSAQESASPVSPQMQFTDPSSVTVKGILGKAIFASRNGRLSELPNWKKGELIQMFRPDVRENHHKTDWYGEHAGKWLYTTAMAVRQSGDEDLKEQLLKTADQLVSNQAPDGYLGVYSPAIRITNGDALHNRSWDVWNLTLMTLGLLEVHDYFPNEKYLTAAKNIGELFLTTFGEGGNDITRYGTRYGISATIALDAVVELYKETRDQRYLDFAELIVKRMEARDNVKLVRVSLNGGDMETVGDGKAYQLLWNLTGLAKLYEVTRNEDYLKAIRNAWQNIADQHLTIAGGPWGGVGKHLECFNKKDFWNPYGFIETCSTMSWIQLNKELLRLTGEARFAHELEKAAYNALLGAQSPNGREWCYHSFSNGRRHIAHFNDCCPSSGAMALEELTTVIYSRKENGVAINLFSESEGEVTLQNANKVKVAQKTSYPFEGKISVTVAPAKRAQFPLFIRIPEWANTADIMVNGKPAGIADIRSGEYVKVDRMWKQNDHVQISFPMQLRVNKKIERVGTPQGGPDMYNVTWFALTRGPLVYASSGLIGGKDRERALGLPADNMEKLFSETTTPNGSKGPAYELKTAQGEKLLFLPYYEADQRNSGTWRLTWIQNGIDQQSAH
ncbi:MAG: beta-L-arabinofuranosidase domain-containing protein [Cyclobacteriaceae bacterium]